jgi:hypothetical protein
MRGKGSPEEQLLEEIKEVNMQHTEEWTQELFHG